MMSISKGCAAALVALALVGCAAPNTTQDLCKRGQECNLLGSGASVQDCTDYYDRCVANLPSSEQEDWRNMVESCLGDNSCTNFIHCFMQVSSCGTSGH